LLWSTEVLCPAPVLTPFMSVEPADCRNGSLPLDKECMFTCAPGFERLGRERQRCSYDGKPVWAPGEVPSCKGTCVTAYSEYPSVSSYLNAPFCLVYTTVPL